MADELRICPACRKALVRRTNEKLSHFATRKFCDMACFDFQKSSDIKSRFWRSVRVGNPDECWPWLGDQSQSGHGRMPVHGKKIQASHIALILSGRPKPSPKSFALHSCDNPPCCNDAHLRWGTPLENSGDMVMRGRTNTPRGERSGHAKLTQELVLQMRGSNLSLAHWQRETGVSRAALCQARNGTTWRHL